MSPAGLRLHRQRRWWRNARRAIASRRLDLDFRRFAPSVINLSRSKVCAMYPRGKSYSTEVRQHPLTEKSHALGFVYAVWIAKLHSRGTRLRERIHLPDYVVGITGDHEALEHPVGGVAGGRSPGSCNPGWRPGGPCRRVE
jgi:hypothetical protein